MKKKRKNFTIVELVVVILIIIILAVATFLGGATVIKQSRITKVKNNLCLYAQYSLEGDSCETDIGRSSGIKSTGA